VQRRYVYEPFGFTTQSGTPLMGQDTNQYRWLGREDERVGLYYLRNRFYSPYLHRFVSRDPLGFGGGDANLYAYAGNSPTNLSDPMGLFGGTQIQISVIPYYDGGSYGGAYTPANLDYLLFDEDSPHHVYRKLGAARQAVAAAAAARAALEGMEFAAPSFGPVGSGDDYAPAIVPSSSVDQFDLGGFEVELVPPEASSEEATASPNTRSVRDPSKLRTCLDACATGGRAWQNFCRSLPEPRLRAGCWALQFAGEVACRGWCFLEFGTQK
jgi:RHS repeat-associated protein